MGAKGGIASAQEEYPMGAKMHHNYNIMLSGMIFQRSSGV
jgi:hypothetical protein